MADADDDKKDEPKQHGTPPPQHGKKWKTEKFVTTKTAEDVLAQQELNKQYEDPNAVPLSVWFTTRGVRDHVKQKMMEAYTGVRRATLEAFDEIFKTF